MKEAAFGLYRMPRVPNLGNASNGEFGRGSCEDTAVRSDSLRLLPNTPVQQSHMASIS